MFRYREEGEPVKYGFNFWKLNDPSSLGFVLRFWHNLGLWFRYSKIRNRWNIYFIKEPKAHNGSR